MEKALVGRITLGLVGARKKGRPPPPFLYPIETFLFKIKSGKIPLKVFYIETLTKYYVYHPRTFNLFYQYENSRLRGGGPTTNLEI